MKKVRLEDASNRVKTLIDLKDGINQIEFEDDIGMKGHIEAICVQMHKELTELQRFIQAVDIELFHKPSEAELQVTKDVYKR